MLRQCDRHFSQGSVVVYAIEGVHAMTTKEFNREIENIRDLAKEVRKSPEKGKELLYMTGMYTKNGNLKKQFR
jgi:hypothetical protein